jgi:hypothetical protein
MKNVPDSADPRPRRRARRRRKAADPVERDFGPGIEENTPPAAATPPPTPSGPIPGLACAGENCLLRPAAELVGKFALSIAGRAALGRAAGSGLEVLKALRDFLNEEIALAERASAKETGSPRYEKIKVE